MGLTDPKVVLIEEYNDEYCSFIKEYRRTPVKAYGSNALTGEYNINRRTLLNAFKDTIKMFQSLAENLGMEDFKPADTSKLEEQLAVAEAEIGNEHSLE